MTGRRWRALVASSACAALLTSGGVVGSAPGSAAGGSSAASAVDLSRPVATASAGRAPSDRRAVNRRRVLALSIDALNPRAIRMLGRSGAPNLTRLLAEGAGTRNARTAVELTATLPNHTGMLTGRPISRTGEPHGVTWNDDRPGSTVQAAAGERVRSVFTSVHAAGGSTALFADKLKFSLFARSWPRAIDRVFLVEERQGAVVRAARRDLRRHGRSFTFVHLAEPDDVGHESGFMSGPYLDAVRRTDRAVGRLLDTIEGSRRLRRTTTVLLTADHGGAGATHLDPSSPTSFRIPFVVWGRGIDRADLYRVNPRYRDPGRRRVRYAGRQPIRNCAVANVATALLGLPAVPGSSRVCDAGQHLRVR